MLVVKIQRVSTLEANVSQRTIKFHVVVAGKIFASFDKYDDAVKCQDHLENPMPSSSSSK
jgi:hypothetical protein